jgi:hypothetical protein
MSGSPRFKCQSTEKPRCKAVPALRARAGRRRMRHLAAGAIRQGRDGLAAGMSEVSFDEWFEVEIPGDDMDALLQRFYHEQNSGSREARQANLHFSSDGQSGHTVS